MIKSESDVTGIAWDELDETMYDVFASEMSSVLYSIFEKSMYEVSNQNKASIIH